VISNGKVPKLCGLRKNKNINNLFEIRKKEKIERMKAWADKASEL
jgi:hypothetical protein